MTLVKCCGMFRPEDIDAVNAAHPDFCGFVIDFPKSHRSVTPEQARELCMSLNPDVAPIGVLVNQPAERAADIAAKCSLYAIQLHGGEDERYIEELRTLTEAAIVKAFKVRTPSDLEEARQSSADYILLDNGQGTGEPFDWTLLAGFERPYFLAGGLTPESIPEAIERLHPFAIDLSSGLETDGLKDPAKIASAVRAARLETTPNEQFPSGNERQGEEA